VRVCIQQAPNLVSQISEVIRVEGCKRTRNNARWATSLVVSRSAAPLKEEAEESAAFYRKRNNSLAELCPVLSRSMPFPPPPPPPSAGEPPQHQQIRTTAAGTLVHGATASEPEAVRVSLGRAGMRGSMIGCVETPWRGGRTPPRDLQRTTATNYRPRWRLKRRYQRRRNTLRSGAATTTAAVLGLAPSDARRPHRRY
jgi:hypothetical protein